MKITNEHYTELERAINMAIAWNGGIEAIVDGYTENKLTGKRLRWDLLYASGLKIGDGKGMSGLPLYEYMNDDHIDTALKKITGVRRNGRLYGMNYI